MKNIFKMLLLNANTKEEHKRRIKINLTIEIFYMIFFILNLSLFLSDLWLSLFWLGWTLITINATIYDIKIYNSGNHNLYK